MSILAIDFETANEKRSSPCALGLAWIERGQIVRREYRLIKPKEMRFGVFEAKVHGLSPSEVKDAQEFPEVISEFLSDIQSGLLLAHNAQFDVDVLCATLALYGIAIPRFSFLCSQRVASRVWSDEKSLKLSALGEKLGISFRHHQADEDAFACAHIILAAAAHLGLSEVLDIAPRLGLRLGFVDEVGVVLCEDLPLCDKNEGVPSFRYAKRLSAFVNEAKTTIPEKSLHFVVKGSSGNQYNVSEIKKDGVFDLKCECTGWKTRHRCRHVHALLYGEVDSLISDNVDDVKKLQLIIKGLGGVPPLYADWLPPPQR
ncbi:3'-5' exonuclease [Rhodopseudomonas palustris]|uniref:Exonuclease n=1 Tax=Rhodopseudomonas palustris (strain BisB18) TaxID=316056 RepID=Q211V1_RHOPB